VGDFTNAAKLRSDAQTLDAHNQRTKDEIEGRRKVAEMQAVSQREVANIQAGATVKAAGMRGGADAEVFAAYVADIKSNNPTWSEEQVKVAAYQQIQKDYRGGEAKRDAAGADAEARRFANLTAGKDGASLRKARQERISIENTPIGKRTEAQKTDILRLMQVEVAELARLREAAKIVPDAPAPTPAPAAAPAATRPPLSSFDKKG